MIQPWDGHEGKIKSKRQFDIALDEDIYEDLNPLLHVQYCHKNISIPLEIRSIGLRGNILCNSLILGLLS